MPIGVILERGVIIPLILIASFSAGLYLLSPLFHPIAFIWTPLFLFLYLSLFLFWLISKFKKEINLVNKFISTETAVFQLRIPPGEEYTPAMMADVFDSLIIPLNADAIGPQFSFEIISHEGSIGFFVHTPREYMEHLQSAFLSFFPNIIIEEADPQIASPRAYTKKGYTYSGFEWKLGKINYLPLRPYNDFVGAGGATNTTGLLLNVCDSLGIDEHIFFQVVVRANIQHSPVDKKRYKKTLPTDVFGLSLEDRDWQDTGKEYINKFIKDNLVVLEEDETGQRKKIDEVAVQEVNAMRGKIKFQTFIVGVRALYVARENSYRESIKRQLSSIFAPLNIHGFNPLAADDETKLKDLDYLYENRLFFQPPVSDFKKRYKKDIGKYLILTTNEVATLFQLPTKQLSIANIRESLTRPNTPINIPS